VTITSDLVGIVTAGGTFTISRPSRVLVLHAGFNRKFTDDTRSLIAIARTTGVNAIFVPEYFPDEKFPPMMNVIRDFINWSDKPSFLISVVLRPGFMISDDTIYIAKNHVIDAGNILQDVLSKKSSWLSVKNDSVSDDPFLARVQSRLDPETMQGLFSSSIVFSNLGFKNFKDFLISIDGSGIMA